MKLGIDISQIIYGTGVSVYTRNLVTSLLEIDKKNDYLFFGGSLRRKKDLLDQVGDLQKIRPVSSKMTPFSPLVLDFLWNRFHFPPLEALAGDLDVFHASDWTHPPAKKTKLVTTIHDLSFLKWPTSVHPQVLAVQKRRLKEIEKRVDGVIAVSGATKKEILKNLKIPEEKITVVYEALPGDVFSFEKANSHNELSKLKTRLGLEKPYFFASGSLAPRKNTERIFSAFDSFYRKNDFQLVVAGECRPKLNLPPGVVLTGFISREDYLLLLSGAEALVYPSLYEGFGLPVLESFALGVPVVTSNVSSLPEVAGEATVLVNPESVEEIAAGMEIALKNKNDLVKKGKEQVKKFSWQKCARETLAIYEKVFKENH